MTGKIDDTMSPQDKFKTLTSQIKDLYKTTRFDRSALIEKNLNDRFAESVKSGDSVKVSDFLDLVEDVFAERKKFLDYRKNVVRQLSEIDKIRLYPQKVSIKQWAAQEQTDSEIYTIDGIKKRNQPIIHLSTPNSQYHEQVIRAGLQTQDEIEMNLVRLEKLMNQGSDISDQEKKKILTKRLGNEGLSDKIVKAAKVSAKQPAKLAYFAADQLGKGIYSRTDAADLFYTKEYNQRREDLARELKSKMNFNHSNYNELMNKILAKLESSKDLIDLASFNELKQILSKQIEEEDREYKSRTEKLDKDLKDLSSEMLENSKDGMQSLADRNDEQWKYRALSIFLIFTPLGAFSIAGNVFNYLDPLSQIFGPIFSSSESLGEGLGSAVTSSQFGFLGQFMDVIEIDKAIEGIFNLPVINQVADLVDFVTDNEISQGLMSEASPLLGSPLLLGAIAASFTISSAPTELALSRETKAAKEKHMKAMENAFKVIEKDLIDGWKTKKDDDPEIYHKGANDFFKEYLDNKYEVLKLANIDASMSQFLTENIENPSTLQLFDRSLKPMIDFFNNKKSVDKDYKISAHEILKFLNEDERSGGKIKAEMRIEFLTLAAVDPNIIKDCSLNLDPIDISDEIKKIKSDPKTLAEKIKLAQENFNQNFYSKIAENKGIKNFNPDVESIKILEVRLKEAELEVLKDDLSNNKNYAPDTKISPISAKELFSRSIATEVSND